LRVAGSSRNATLSHPSGQGNSSKSGPSSVISYGIGSSAIVQHQTILKYANKMVNKIKQKLVAIAELQMLFQFALKTMIWNEGFQFI